jgi:hypothetical protein
MIPMEEMEGRSSDAAHRRLVQARAGGRSESLRPTLRCLCLVVHRLLDLCVQSAVDGGFNTLRLWGGGIFQWDAWYDACDELGVLVYHDMLYANIDRVPTVTPTQTAELQHQVGTTCSFFSFTCIHVKLFLYMCHQTRLATLSVHRSAGSHRTPPLQSGMAAMSAGGRASMLPLL